MEQSIEPKKHSSLGASGSGIWLRCPGSVALAAKAPPQLEGPSAKEGTARHEELEKNLRGYFKEIKGVRNQWRGVHPKCDTSVLEAVKYIVDRFHSYEFDPIILIEEKVELSFIDPELYGTVDCAIIDEGGTLEVIDYKNGVGLVEVKDNTQMIYYALGIAHKYDFNFSEVKLTIIQPNAEHAEGSIRSWTIPVDKLKNYIDLFSKGVARTRKPNAPLFAGDHCKWCKGKLLCPKIAHAALMEARTEFEDITEESKLPAPKDLEPKQIAKLLEVSSRIEQWCEDVQKYATDLLERKGKIPGYHLVPKRSKRVWTDARKVEKIFAKLTNEEIFTPSELLSPTQMEKLKPARKGIDMKQLVASNVSYVSSGFRVDKIKNEFSPLDEEPKLLTRKKRGKNVTQKRKA